MRAIETKSSDRQRAVIQRITIGVLLVLIAGPLLGQTAGDWQQRVRNEVKDHHLDAATTIVDQRLVDAPEDLEAHGWRGRLLAWKGRWSDGEAEYELVLEKVPDDIDMLTGLADVLLWQQKYSEALRVLDRARTISPSDPAILAQRARVLSLLGRTREARSEYLKTLQFDPKNQDARANLAGLREETNHELRVGEDVDFFNYTDAAQTQSVSLRSHWNPRWSTVFGVSTYQRFGQDAVKFLGSTAFHITPQDWISVGSAVASGQDIVPTNEAFFEYGHGFRLVNRWVRGLESSYQQHWFWYQGAHVLTLATNQIVYLPRDWTWSLNVTGARTGFVGTPIDWAPSGWTKLGFPLRHRVTGNLFFAVGSENFAQIDQIGRFSAHTYGGGLRYQFAAQQDINGYVARQTRTQGQIDTSFGLSYGIHF
ncbi:MAG TPA: tetratricopeptide repeat protein [Terriglobales bacterium]|nr:tetratricopeptide repeat protein [Terriglobales bacterium]